MKKLLFYSIIFVVICSVSLNGQSNQPKLNQVELSKKLIGVWQEQVFSDTIPGFEMSLYKDAVLETWFRTVNGTKELLGTSSFIYDPALDKFKGYFIIPNGRLTYYYFKFSSDKEVVFERVEDFNSNKLVARNKFVLPDADHLNGAHYNANEVQYNTSKWVKTNSWRIENEAQTNQVAQADNQFSQAILNKDIGKMSVWYVNNSIMIFEDGTVENGKNEILDGWSTAFKDVNFSVKRELNEVKVLGNGSAYTMGSWERKQSNAEGKVVVVTGKYVEFWVKQQDGNWKVLIIKV